MAGTFYQAFVEIIPTAKGFKPALEKEFAGVDNIGKDTGGKFSSGFGGALRGLGIALAGALSVGAIKNFVSETVKAASDLNETGTAVEAIFGSASEGLNKLAASAPSALGQTRQQFLDAAKTFGVFGNSAGLAAEDNAAFSVELTNLASDLASFNNTTVDEAIMALGSGLRGEAEPLRRYGVLLDDATLKAKAMEMGIFDGTGSLTQQQRVLAAQQVIMSQTALQQGDFAKTSDGLANSQRILTANFDDMKATVGQALLPAFASLSQGLVPIIDQLGPILTSTFEQLTPVVENLSGMIPRLLEGFLPLVPVIGELAAMFLEVLLALLPFIAEVAMQLMPVLTDLLPIVLDIIDAALEPLMEVMYQLMEPLGPIISDLLPIFADLIRELAPVIQELMYQLIPIVQELMPVFMELFRAVVPLILALAQAIIPIVLMILPLFVKLLQFLLPIMVWLINLVVGLVTGFVSLVTGIQDAPGKIQEIWENVVTWFTKLPGRIAEFFTELPAMLLGIGENIMNGLWEGIKAVFRGIEFWFIDLPVKIISFFLSAGRWLYDNGDDILAGMWEGIKNAYIAVRQWFIDLPGNILDFFVAAGAWLLEVGQNIIQGLWDGIKAIWEFVKWWYLDMPGVVVGWLAGAIDWLYDVGKDILTGLWNGLKNVWTSIANWVSEKVDWIINSFKNALEIGSPSKVFFGFGQGIGQGLVLGMDSMSKNIDSTVSTMVKVPNPSSVLSSFESQGYGGSGMAVNYYAAPNKSFDAEQELLLAMRRVQVIV